MFDDTPACRTPNWARIWWKRGTSWASRWFAGRQMRRGRRGRGAAVGNFSPAARCQLLEQSTPEVTTLLAALMLATMAQEPYQTVQVGRVTVMAPAALANLGVAMGERADQPALWPGLGRRDPLPMRLVVVPDEAAFGRISRGRVPDWGVGIALPAARTIVVRADAPDPMAALRHELAHLALHGALAGRVRVPLWFDEGYAVVAAGEWNRFDALQLNLAVARGRVGDLRALDASLRRGPVEAETAYAPRAPRFHLARLHPQAPWMRCGRLHGRRGLLGGGASTGTPRPFRHRLATGPANPVRADRLAGSRRRVGRPRIGGDRSGCLATAARSAAPGGT
jgi:hypothetical protein